MATGAKGCKQCAECYQVMPPRLLHLAGGWCVAYYCSMHGLRERISGFVGDIETALRVFRRVYKVPTGRAIPSTWEGAPV